MSSYPRARQLHTPFDSGWLRLCWHGRRARHPVPGQRSNAWYHITPSGHHNQMEWRWWIRVYNLFSGNFLDFFIIGKCPSTNKSLLFSFFSFPFWEFYSFSFYIPTTMDLGQHFSDRLWRSIFLFLFWLTPSEIKELRTPPQRWTASSPPPKLLVGKANFTILTFLNWFFSYGRTNYVPPTRNLEWILGAPALSWLPSLVKLHCRSPLPRANYIGFYKMNV